MITIDQLKAGLARACARAGLTMVEGSGAQDLDEADRRRDNGELAVFHFR